MNKYIPIIDLDARHEVFDLLAIVELDPSLAMFHKKENIHVYTYDPDELIKTVYLQAYDDAWEMNDEIRYGDRDQYDTFEEAQRGLIIRVLLMRQQL